MKRETCERVSLEPNTIRSLLNELDESVPSGYATRFTIVGDGRVGA